MTRVLALRLALSFGAFSLLACAQAPAAPAPEPARVTVEVLSGSSSPAAPSPGAVAVVIDASSSMRAPAAAGVSRLAAAQTRAREVIESLAPGTLVLVEVAGGAGSGACAAPARVTPLTADTAAASAAVAKLAPGADAALAAALQDAARSLAATASGGRVIAFTDLADDCGGDLCAAASAVVAAGASLDLVVLGDRPTPSCVESAGGAAPAGPVAERPAGPVRFDVTPASGSAVAGVAGAPPVAVPAGPVRIVVALTPPFELGPVTLGPGAVARVRVLDFPAASPPIREWSFELLGARDDVAGAPAAATPQSP